MIEAIMVSIAEEIETKPWRATPQPVQQPGTSINAQGPEQKA